MKRSANAYHAMCIAIAMYGVKIASKLLVGGYVASPMIVGDGYHNISDVFEALAVIGVMALAARRSSERFPFGFRMFENLGELLIGLSMLWMAFSVFRDAASGLLAFAPSLDAAVRSVVTLPHHEPVKLGARYFPLVVAVTLGNAVLSLLVGRHQVAVGRASGRVSLVADGEETKSDGRIEIAMFVGILGEYLFRAPWLEYPFALIVSGLIARTGIGILLAGGASLVKRSIGADHETAIRRLTSSVRGITDVAELKTFRTGGHAVCIIKVLTRAPIGAHLDLKLAVVDKLAPYLTEAGFAGSECFIRFDTPPKDRHRVAYLAIRQGATLTIAPDEAEATHVLVCDVEDGEIVRWKEWPKPEDLPTFLVEKRARTLYVFSRSDMGPGAHESAVIPTANAVSYAPEVLGLKAP